MHLSFFTPTIGIDYSKSKGGKCVTGRGTHQAAGGVGGQDWVVLLLRGQAHERGGKYSSGWTDDTEP